FSDKPLRLAVRFGFVISSLAFAYGAYIVYRVLMHGVPIPGWTSLIVSLYFLSGIIISILGIIGVYLGKTFDEVKRRPLYLISNRT
ncbi:MAG: glycosyltransferase, partial [Sideroxydans sp.]|nr:glycosyltransferase [Sideroxydans sp.]